MDGEPSERSETKEAARSLTPRAFEKSTTRLISSGAEIEDKMMDVNVECLSSGNGVEHEGGWSKNGSTKSSDGRKCTMRERMRLQVTAISSSRSSSPTSSSIVVSQRRRRSSSPWGRFSALTEIKKKRQQQASAASFSFFRCLGSLALCLSRVSRTPFDHSASCSRQNTSARAGISASISHLRD